MIDWENKIIAYVHGDLSQVETDVLMIKVENSKELRELLNIYQNIDEDFRTLPEELPTSNLSNNFLDHLSQIKSKENNTVKKAKIFSLKKLLRYAAASIILFAAGVTLWNQIDRKESTEQYAINSILSDMKNKSDTEKIKALYVNNDLAADTKSKIKEVLIESLKNDRSSNVRLASVETLSDYVSDENVRSALIRSLGVEVDPQVQLAIIIALSKSKSEEIIKPLEEIINKEGGYKFVKDEAHVGIMNVTSI